MSYLPYPQMPAIIWPYADHPSNFLQYDYALGTLLPITVTSGPLSIPFTFQFGAPPEPPRVVQVFAMGAYIEHRTGFYWNWWPFEPYQSYEAMVGYVTEYIASTETTGGGLPAGFAQFGAAGKRAMMYSGFDRNFAYNYYSQIYEPDPSWTQYFAVYTWDVYYVNIEILVTDLVAPRANSGITPNLVGAMLILLPFLVAAATTTIATATSTPRYPARKPSA
jgi:hypothetical protein